MKHITRHLKLIIATLAITVMFCGNNAEAAKKPTMVKQVTMHVGEHKIIKVRNAGKRVVWKCSNNKAIKIEKKGKYKAAIYAKKKGTVTLKATTGRVSLRCRVTVKEKPLQDWNTDINVKVGYDKTTSKKYAAIHWNDNSSADGYYIYRVIKPSIQDVSKVELIKKIKGNKTTSYNDLEFQDVKSLEAPAYYVVAYKKLKKGKIIYCETEKKIVAVD